MDPKTVVGRPKPISRTGPSPIKYLRYHTLPCHSHRHFLSDIRGKSLGLFCIWQCLDCHLPSCQLSQPWFRPPHCSFCLDIHEQPCQMTEYFSSSNVLLTQIKKWSGKSAPCPPSFWPDGGSDKSNAKVQLKTLNEHCAVYAF